MYLKTDIRISIKNNTTGESHQENVNQIFRFNTQFFNDNTKFVLKSQTKFL